MDELTQAKVRLYWALTKRERSQSESEAQMLYLLHLDKEVQKFKDDFPPPPSTPEPPPNAIAKLFHW